MLNLETRWYRYALSLLIPEHVASYIGVFGILKSRHSGPCHRFVGQVLIGVLGTSAVGVRWFGATLGYLKFLNVLFSLYLFYSLIVIIQLSSPSLSIHRPTQGLIVLHRPQYFTPTGFGAWLAWDTRMGDAEHMVTAYRRMDLTYSFIAGHAFAPVMSQWQ